MWRNRFARGFGPVVWQITDDDDDDDEMTVNTTQYFNAKSVGCIQNTTPHPQKHLSLKMRDHF